jgi:hypothetical protein
MLTALAWAALRRRPFSVLITLILVVISASLLRIPVAAALLVWILASLLALEVWLVLERFVLERQGCRELSEEEHARIAAWLQRANITVRVADDPHPWVGNGFRSVVVSEGALELLEDRGLLGLLAQAAAQTRSPIQLREIVVWLGSAPLVAVWCASCGLAQLANVLAHAIGWALVLPMLLWPRGFVLWVGRLLGAVIVALLGAVLLSSGFAAAGLGLWSAWALVPGLRALLAWESRRAEADADQTTVRAGYGAELVDGLKSMSQAHPQPPHGPLRLLARPGKPVHERARRVAATITIDS